MARRIQGTRQKLGFKAAIDWLINNDDCYYLDDIDCNTLSVAASLVADLYGYTDSEVLNALREARNTIRD